MTRKLVTVRRISALTPIPGADRVQTASVGGWHCVVSVGDFQPGDLGLYFEIDSLLPGADPRWAFLAPQNAARSKSSPPPEDIRIKTIRIRKVLSQGPLMPLAAFPEVVEVLDALERDLGRPGMEARRRTLSFEDVLGVRKFEKPAPEFKAGSGAEPLADFPDFVPKTDQERVQNLPDVFAAWRDAVFQETTKMDGSSMAVYFIRRDSPLYDALPALPPGESDGSNASQQPNGRVGVCSRNRELGEQTRSMALFWTVARAAGIPAALSRCGRNLALQGELCGSSIQSNFEGFAAGAHAFYLFAIWDVDAQRYLPPREVHETWAPRLGVPHVAVEGYRPLREIASSVSDLVARAGGKGIHGRKREGIVLKHVDGAFSFKAISNSYLLKHGE